MATFNSFKVSKAMSIHNEAIRAIKGYDQWDPDREVKANIDYEKTRDNIVLIRNECMNTAGKDYKKASEGIERLYTETAGHAPRKNAVVGSIIVTLPREQLDYQAQDLTAAEYTALGKRFEYEEAGKTLNSHDEALSLRAMEKLSHIEWSAEQKEQIREYFDAMVGSLCTTCGIKQSDVLYAVVHMDESFPHLHFCFLPMQYGKERFDEAITIAEQHPERTEHDSNRAHSSFVTVDEQRVNLTKDRRFIGLTDYEPGENESAAGCSIKRFGKGFLHMLNQNLEREMAARGIETHLSNGKGQQFEALQQSKEMRMRNAALENQTVQISRENARARRTRETLLEQLDSIQSELVSAEEYKRTIKGAIKQAASEILDKLERARDLFERAAQIQNFNATMSRRLLLFFKEWAGIDGQEAVQTIVDATAHDLGIDIGAGAEVGEMVEEIEQMLDAMDGFDFGEDR